MHFICAVTGVTTVVDAGSSGAMTFAGLRHFVAERSDTRVLCLLHIAVHGLAGAGCADAGGGESDHLNALSVSGKHYNHSKGTTTAASAMISTSNAVAAAATTAAATTAVAVTLRTTAIRSIRMAKKYTNCNNDGNSEYIKL